MRLHDDANQKRLLCRASDTKRWLIHRLHGEIQEEGKAESEEWYETEAD